MGWTYSERLIGTAVTGSWVYWTVPALKRTVVTFVSGINGGSAQGHVSYSVAGHEFERLQVPAGAGARTERCHAVAYAGESVGVFLAGDSLVAHVSAFVFDDPVGRMVGAVPLPAPSWPPPLGT